MPFPEIILLVYRFTSFIVVHKQHCLIKEVHDLTCVRTVQYLIHGALSACMCILFSVCVWCQNTITWWKFETRPVSQWVHNPDASKSRWTACLLNLQPINCKLTRHVGVTQLLPCNPVVRSTPSDDQSPWSPFSCFNTLAGVLPSKHLPWCLQALGGGGEAPTHPGVPLPSHWDNFQHGHTAMAVSSSPLPSPSSSICINRLFYLVVRPE